jgi:hypothetical protein
MNIVIRTALVAVWLLIGTAFLHAGDFEGILHMKTTLTEMKTASMSDWYIKGDVARMERSHEEGQGSAMIMDGQKRSMIILMPEKKVAMEFTLDATSDTMAEHMKEEFEKKVVDRTGKTEKIAGYPCEVWRISDKETKNLEHEICVAKGFGRGATAFLDPKRLQQSSQPSWVKQLAKEGGFGMRSIGYDDLGKEASRTEVVGVEKKRLDASLFVVPADYTRQNMGDMVNRMKAAREQMQQKQGQKQPDFEKLMRDAEQRRAQRQGEGGSGADAPPPEAAEMMRKIQEMMKKQQGSGQ